MWLANANEGDTKIILRTWPVLFTGPTNPPELCLEADRLFGIHINQENIEQCSALNEQSGSERKDN